MKLSVVIPVRNRPDQIRRCLAGVLGGAFPADRFEVLVVDNGSTDSTARVAEEAGARVLSEPAPNRCRARNLGAREARGRWVAFLDSDCVPDPDWLEMLARAIDKVAPEEPVALLAGLVRPAAPQTPVEAYIARRRWIDQEKFLSPGRRFSPPFAATANLAVRRDVWLELGGLDPELAVAGEDADFCWRAARAGWRILYVPEAAVTHHHRATLGGLWRQAYHYGIGQADLFAQWRGEWGARVWIEPKHYVWALKALLKTPVSFALSRGPLERREPFYDFLSNLALVAGRIAGGLRHRALIL
jgi:GT2 family glycosyltransferase